MTEVKSSTRAAIELEPAKELLNNILNSCIDGILVGDPDGYITMVNESAAEMLGYSKDEMIGKHPLELEITPQAEKESGKEAIEKLLERDSLKGLKRRWIKKDGSSIDIEMNLALMKDRKGKVVGSVGSFRDVTVREKTEKQLIESRDYLENIIESSLDSIVVVDERGLLTKVNNAFLQLTGFSKEEVIGKHMSEFAPLRKGTYACTSGELIQIDEEFYNHVESNMLVFQEKGSMRNAISYLLRKDNKIIPVEDNMVYLSDKDGMRIGAVAITRDVTERRKTERKILDYQSQLKALTVELILTEEKERRHFAKYLHDEIGQYLFVSQMHLKLLKDSLASTEYTKTLDNVLNNIQHMIDNSRSLTFELSPPILYELGFEKALEWFAEQIYKQHNINVTLEDDNQERALDDEMKSFLYQAVRELLINVAKHAKTQFASVSIERENSNIRISVKDDGIGFDPSIQDSACSCRTFGLFSIKERLDQLGGHLEITSQPNRGTRITLVAPLCNGI